jgi:hypothetical protein
VEDVRMVMEYCEKMGKHLLENYEQFFDGGDTAWESQDK